MMKSNDTPVIELVVYRIKSALAGQYPEMQKTIAKGLAREFPGFISFKTTQSMDDPLVFIDHVQWDNYKNARHAADKIKDLEQFSPLFEAIEEILYYGHLHNLSSL